MAAKVKYGPWNVTDVKFTAAVARRCARDWSRMGRKSKVVRRVIRAEGATEQVHVVLTAMRVREAT